jgi:hypothetical protein
MHRYQDRAHRAGRTALLIALFCAGFAAFALADSVPFWGAKESLPADTPLDQLKKGQFVWMANVVDSGPMVMVVSLTEQRAYVYRNGILIGATSVSTGRPGHLTPTGVFTVLQKQKEHRSTIYDGAPMPYMERLTWGGVALHAGGIPGYPESHGCIHLPSEFARELFAISPRGMTVVIASTATAPTSVNHPGYLSPVGAVGGAPIELTPLTTTEEDRWQPDASPSGPVSIVLSRQSQRIVVYRNGIEIGRARISISGDQPLSTHALVLATGPSPFADLYVPDPTKYRWERIGVPGHLGEAGGDPDPATIGRIKIPPDFVKEVASVLSPGATVLVTDHAMFPTTTGPHLQLIDADPPASPGESEHQG